MPSLCSYKTTLCIQYNADAVAVAAAYLAMKLHKVEVPERMEGWPLSWGVKDDELKGERRWFSNAVTWLLQSH